MEASWRVDVLLPHAQAREDVTGHVGGMRTGGRDLAVMLGGQRGHLWPSRDCRRSE